MPKESKCAKDAQEERNETKEPTKNVWVKKTQCSMGINPMTILSH